MPHLGQVLLHHLLVVVRVVVALVHGDVALSMSMAVAVAMSMVVAVAMSMVVAMMDVSLAVGNRFVSPAD